MKALLYPLLLLTGGAQAAEPFFQQLTLPGGQVVTVAVGHGEPASIGSYDVRLYSGAQPEFPLDQFIAGMVLPRDGGIKEVKLADLNGDKQPELIVAVESAGSGSYLSADAFVITQEGIENLAHQEGLAPNTDLIKVLSATP